MMYDYKLQLVIRTPQACLWEQSVGGDLYEQEQRFFDLVKSRAEDTVEKWVQSLNCPIIRIDGTKPIEENINLIIEQIK